MSCKNYEWSVLKMKIIVAIVSMFCVVFLSAGGWDFIFCERGEIIGEFRNGTTEGFGDFCGEYPHTSLLIHNSTVNGNIVKYGGKFHFGNEIDYLDVLEVGEYYTFYYHQEWRGADTTSGDRIYYYVLDGYKQWSD